LIDPEKTFIRCNQKGLEDIEMKLKKEFMVLAVIVAALILYILLKSTDKTHYSLPEHAKISRSDITKLIIDRPGGSLIVEGQGEDWKIQPQGYPADQAMIDRMLKAVEEFELSTLVSESKNYVQYELTDDKKIALEVFSGEKSLLKLDIGKTASTYQHTYVRLDGDDKVYQARGNMRQPLDMEIDRLRDKVVATVERDFVTGIILQGPEETLTIQKYEEPPIPVTTGEEDSTAAASPPPAPVWTTEDGREAQENAVNGIIGALANLRCTEYIEDKSKEDFTDPVFTITVQGTSSLTLQIFEKQEDNKYPAVSSQNDYPFLLTEGVVNRFKKTPDEVLVQVEEEE
jgi:hypothetical protein